MKCIISGVKRTKHKTNLTFYVKSDESCTNTYNVEIIQPELEICNWLANIIQIVSKNLDLFLMF